VAGININQTLMVVVFIISLILFILKHTILRKRFSLGLTVHHEKQVKEKSPVTPTGKGKETTRKIAVKKVDKESDSFKVKPESKKSGASKTK
jgi:hypothetical protein